VDGGDILWCEFDGFVPESGVESFIAEGDSEDTADAVAIPCLHDDGADDVVESGAEPAARDDGAGGFRGIEKDFAARSGQFDGFERRVVLDRMLDDADVVVEEDPVTIRVPSGAFR